MMTGAELPPYPPAWWMAIDLIDDRLSSIPSCKINAHTTGATENLVPSQPLSSCCFCTFSFGEKTRAKWTAHSACRPTQQFLETGLALHVGVLRWRLFLKQNGRGHIEPRPSSSPSCRNNCSCDSMTTNTHLDRRSILFSFLPFSRLAGFRR